MNNLASSYDEAGRQDEALRLREQVLVLRRKVSGPDHPDTILAMNNLAVSYDEAGRREEALKLREEVLALRRKVNGPENPDTILAMHSLAISYDEAGRLEEALKLREQVLALRRKALNPDHRDTILRCTTWRFPTTKLVAWRRRSSCGSRCWPFAAKCSVQNTLTRSWR